MTKIDTKYASEVMRKLARNRAGAVALLLDRLLYDIGETDGKISVRRQLYIGKEEESARWVAPGEGENYADSLAILREARDELYALGLGQI